jgi:hypothetical protein
MLDILSVVLLLIGILFFLLGLILPSLKEDVGEVSLLILVLSVVLFFISAASFVYAGEEYIPYTWMCVGLALIGLVLCFVGAFELFGE